MERAVADQSNPERLAAYIQSLPDFRIYTEIDGNYGHMGATLADAVLQANNNYERNVRPRISRIRNKFARDASLDDLKRLLKHVSPQKFLDWNGTRKPKTFLELVDLLDREGVNTEVDLRTWLQRDGSGESLRRIRFIGPKTVDYLKILVGLPNAAVDRHMVAFVERAGLGKLDYDRCQEVLHRTADLMKLDRAHLDHSIWRYMSGDETAVSKGGPCRGHFAPTPKMKSNSPASDGAASWQRRILRKAAAWSKFIGKYWSAG